MEGGNLSNVSKTIVKQGLKGCLVYCANVPITIENIDYEEGGVSTCAQQWNTANIRKRKPSVRFNTEFF